MKYLTQLSILASLALPSFATPLPEERGLLSGVPVLGTLFANNTYDYVVVGAGTAGMTLAARLSEDPNVKVAVIEAGVDPNYQPINQILIQTPGADVIGCGAEESDFLNNAIDWGFVTAPQKGANNREIRYARGKCIGGSSARNFMIMQRPSKGSLDQWAGLTGDSSWNFNDRLPDFKKSFTFTPPKHELRQEEPAAQYNPASFAGSAGAVQVSYANTPQNFSKYMQLSLNENGVQTINDFNLGNLNGVQYNPSTIDPKDGHRSTSRSFYEQAKSRANLVVYQSATAKKVVFDNSTIPKAVGVQYSQAGATKGLYATKEVIVSAGAFHSPQLLMVSGIGPKAQLQAQNISMIVQNENVGQNMQDHIFFSPSYPVSNDVKTFTKLAGDPVYLTAQLANFTANVLGPLTNPVADMIAFDRINDAQLAQMGASVLSTYPQDWPHVEWLSAPGVIDNFANLFAENLKAKASTGKDYASILGALVAPQSRGTVTLASADTKDLPVIDPAWLTSPVDQKVAIYLFKRIRTLFATQAMAPILDGPEYTPGPQVQSDEDILNFIRNSLLTVWHAACTCAMSKSKDTGVLNSKFQVFGVSGLRVVDASSMPMLPPGHPQSTIYMMAERAATLIKQANA